MLRAMRDLAKRLARVKRAAASAWKQGLPPPKTLRRPRNGRVPPPSMIVTTQDRPDGGMDIHIRLNRSEVRLLRRDREFLQARSPGITDDAGTVRLMIDYARHRFEYVRKLNREIARLRTEWPDLESDLIQ